ncbi:hypothetical protein NLI96_g4099 [Meripilus lineatus]|uniref:Uncharacterized protein n=1 Tax=Meripilus lineatus TaxID=2056292 RepID=A0AAD5V5T4_9APHY|nr:hypothetical protein NLI96_g4099 [Physisporinus lineatus]
MARVVCTADAKIAAGLRSSPGYKCAVGNTPPSPQVSKDRGVMGSSAAQRFKNRPPSFSFSSPSTVKFAATLRSVAMFVFNLFIFVTLGQFGFVNGIDFSPYVILDLLVSASKIFLVGLWSLFLVGILSWFLRIPWVRYIVLRVIVVTLQLPSLVQSVKVNTVSLVSKVPVDIYYYSVFFVFGLLVSWIITAIGQRKLKAVISSLESDNISFWTLNSSLLTEIDTLEQSAAAERKAAEDKDAQERMKHCITQLKFERTLESHAVLEERVRQQESRMADDKRRIRDLERMVGHLQRQVREQEEEHKNYKDQIEKRSFEILLKDLERSQSSSLPTVNSLATVTSHSDTDYTSESMSLTEIIQPLPQEQDGSHSLLSEESVEALSTATVTSHSDMDYTSESMSFTEIFSPQAQDDHGLLEVSVEALVNGEGLTASQSLERFESILGRIDSLVDIDEVAAHMEWSAQTASSATVEPSQLAESDSSWDDLDLVLGKVGKVERSVGEVEEVGLDLEAVPGELDMDSLELSREVQPWEPPELQSNGNSFGLALLIDPRLQEAMMLDDYRATGSLPSNTRFTRSMAWESQSTSHEAVSVSPDSSSRTLELPTRISDISLLVDISLGYRDGSLVSWPSLSSIKALGSLKATLSRSEPQDTPPSRPTESFSRTPPLLSPNISRTTF